MLALWPQLTTLALRIGKPYFTVHAWAGRNNIPAVHWPAIAQAAVDSGLEGVTVEALRDAADRAKATKPPRRNAAQPRVAGKTAP
jgi:hypothetical protein